MRRTATLTLATTIAALSLANAALAKPEYVGRVPNDAAEDVCVHCHTDSEIGSLNAFGVDVSQISNTPAGGWWKALRDVDSDKDTQTNGQELGDPCGEWAIGETPGRITNISNPGLAEETSDTPDDPICEATGSGGSGGGATTTTTGAATTTGGPGTTTGGNPGTTTGGNPAGGQGGAGVSAGAGYADAPPKSSPPGACAFTPTSSDTGLAVAFFAALALFFTRVRPRRTDSK